MTERTWTRAALGIVLLPFGVSAVALVLGAGDYLPVSDHALIEMRIRDIGTHPVLTGLYSRNDWSHPGPLYFYVLAPLYRLAGSASIAVNLGALLINATSIVGMAVVARRRGGVPLLLVTLAACALVVRTLGVDFVSDPWNTYVTVLPFGLLVFLVWAMACGETWALPVGAVAASFLAQTHVGFLVLAVPLFAVGAAWLAATRGRDTWPAAAWAAGLLALVWSPVVVDLVTGTTGNLGVAYDWFRHGGDDAHSVLEGWRVVSGQLEVPPEWLVAHREPLWLTGEPVFLYQTPRPLLVPLVALSAWWFRRRGEGDGLRLLAVFGLTFALAVVAVWRTVGLAFDYRLRWTWVVGLLSAVVVAWAAATWRRREVTALAVAALIGASSVSAAVATRGETPRQADTAVLAALLPGVLAAVGDDPAQVVVHGGGYAGASWYTRSLVLLLERRGVAARMLPDERPVVGPHRVVGPAPVSHTFVVAVDGEIERWDRDPGVRRVASWTSVTDDQRRAHDRLVARLDRSVAAGTMAPVERAMVLHERGLATLDEAVAWAVAVYLETDPPQIPT